MDDLTRFTNAYLECAVWSSLDEEGTPLDQHPSELSAQALDKLKTDARAFWEANEQTIGAAETTHGLDNATMAGHDFWLTRNGHGAGFWDGGWSEPHATELDKASKAFGECYLYVGDDGLVYTA